MKIKTKVKSGGTSLNHNQGLDRLKRITMATSLCTSVLVASPATAAGGSSSSPLWVRYLDGAGHASDVSQRLVVDALGNVYVTGSSDGVGANRDITTAKYDTNGNLLWVRTYDGPVSGADLGKGIALDGANVYVTGISDGGSTDLDIVTIKYAASDTCQGMHCELWAARYDGPSHGPDELPNRARPIGVDPFGNVYVTGSSSFPGGGWDNRPLLRYRPDGVLDWVQRYPGASGSALAIDPSGAYVIVTGYGNTTTWLTTKYSASSLELWTAPSVGGSATTHVAIALDPAGNAYVTGGFLGDVGTIKYDGGTGAPLWNPPQRTYHSSYGGGFATSIAIDVAGRIDVGGAVRGKGSVSRDFIYDAATIQYDSSGNQRWAKTYHATSQGTAWDDVIVDLTVDGSSNVIVLGPAQSAYSFFDLITIKYDSAGTQKWVRTFDSGYWDSASSVAADGSGSIYVSGWSQANGNDWTTLKYAP